jgi:hypothetical protein
MPGDEQRRISKTYISAFLPLFEDWRIARDWLPDTLYMNRYEDASFIPLASYHEDADLTTTTGSGRQHRRRKSLRLERGPHPLAVG